MASGHHNLPPGVQGDTRGHLSLAVDEVGQQLIKNLLNCPDIFQVVWLHGSGGASVLAEWWGSKLEEQVSDSFDNLDNVSIFLFVPYLPQSSYNRWSLAQLMSGTSVLDQEAEGQFYNTYIQ